MGEKKLSKRSGQSSEHITFRNAEPDNTFMKIPSFSFEYLQKEYITISHKEP